jgi:hypothetical protein
MLDSVFDAFARKSPVTVMARAMMERAFNPDQLNQWFENTAEVQYTRQLLFSSVFDIMTQVACGHHSSVHGAFQASKEDIGVSITSLYNKLNGIESHTSAELVRYAAGQIQPLIEQLGGAQKPLMPGFRIKLLDGNCIAATEHRIKELRSLASGALPGKSLVVYDPSLHIPIDVFPSEDGHAQERSLLQDILPTVEEGDLWVADRNFCVRSFVLGIHSMGAYFVIRKHKKLPYTLIGKEQACGSSDGGAISEQHVIITDESGNECKFRLIRIVLKKATRDGDKEIYLITNLSRTKGHAKQLAGLYRKRWTIGVSREGHIIQSVKVRPGTKGSIPVAWEAPWRESKMVEPSDRLFRKEMMQGFRPQRAVNADVASLHAIPVAETVYNARRQQGSIEKSPRRRLSPAGYQRWHVAKDCVSTGEALGARRRNLAEEVVPITLSGKWEHRHQGGGLGCSTVDRCAAKRTGREGPRPMIVPSERGEAGAR